MRPTSGIAPSGTQHARTQRAEQPYASPGRRASLAGTNASYADLRQQLTQESLLERRPGQYLQYGLAIVALFGAATVALTQLTGIAGLTLGALLLTLAFIQIVFVAHDAGHNQVFPDRKRNRRLLFVTSFLLGTSALWWLDKHTRHHAVPNHDGIDSDISLPLLAFSAEQVAAKRGISRRLIRHQGWLWLAMMPLEGFWPQLESAKFLSEQKPADYRWHLTALLTQQALVATVLFVLVGLWPAIYVGLLAHSLFGIYMVLVFVTNHTAMPLSEGPVSPRFMETQLRTTRNVAVNPLADILFGGLNFQIEHHLFPAMARPRLRAASHLVRRYVQEKGLEYRVDGFVSAYRDVHEHMLAVGRMSQTDGVSTPSGVPSTARGRS